MYKKKTRVSNSEAAKDRHSEKTEQRRGHNLAAQSKKKKKNLQPKKEIDYQIACLERIQEWMLDSELFNGSAKCC